MGARNVTFYKLLNYNGFKVEGFLLPLLPPTHPTTYREKVCYAVGELIGGRKIMTLTYRKQVEVETEATPQDVAEMFWAMDDEQQVQFLNHLGKISGGEISMQMEAITNSSDLEFDGRYVMRQFGEYADGEPK